MDFTIIETDGERALVRRPIETEDYDDEGHVVGRNVEDADLRARTVDEWWPLDEAIERARAAAAARLVHAENEFAAAAVYGSSVTFQRVHAELLKARADVAALQALPRAS